MVEQTATATALGQASGTASRHSAQNVRYKMKYNAATGKWEQEQIMTPLVQSVYPGIRTKEGKTKDISTGLVSEPIATLPVEPTTPEPEVTPLPTMTDGTPTTGLGTYREVQEQYKQPIPITTGGIKYEEGQISGVSESQQDKMKYNVMPGGLNYRSAAQNLSLSQSHGLIEDLVNPTVKTEEEIKSQKKKLGMLPGAIGAFASFAGTAIQPRSERLQITKMIEAGALQVRDKDGNLLSNADAIKKLTQDENGRLKILKGQELINSGLKITQAKHLSKDYVNSAAFMNFQEDKENNMNTPTWTTEDGQVMGGIKLTTLNPVMGSSGTNFFGILKDPIGESDTNGEQVLVVGASNGGAYRSDGKFVGMNSQIYAYGTAAQAQESANSGHIPLSVLERMTNEDGTLKNLYLGDSPVGNFAIDPKWISADGKYTGNVVDEDRNVITNGGNGSTIGNTAPDGSIDKDNYVKGAQERTEERMEDKETGTGGSYGGDQEDRPVIKPKPKEKPKTCFHPEQLIGNKFIKELQPGDFINGKEIYGMIKLKLNEDMYSINNVRVTGSHGMKYKDKWIFVADHPESFKIDDKPKFVYIPIVETGTFTINNEEFADYDYHDMVLLGDEEWKKRRGFQKAA